MEKITFDDIRIGDEIRSHLLGVTFSGVVGFKDEWVAASGSGGVLAIPRDEEIYLVYRPTEQSPVEPTVGRIVHFRARTEGVISPAVILRTDGSTVPEALEGWEPRPKGFKAALEGSTVDLLVHGLSGDYREYAVPYSSSPEKRTWTWPPQV